MALKSDIEQQLKAMITRGSVPESMRIGNALAKIPAAIERGKEKRAIQSSRDLTTISGFEARIGNKVSNYMASGDIYDESKITVLKDSINSLYDKHSSQFPELIAEFSDERDSALGIINNYSTKNKQKDLLLSKIEPTKDRLYNIAKTLGETTTADLSPDDRVKFRQEVRSAMEDVVTLDKLIEDPYYSNLSGWADVAEDVKYGISDASKQLLTQINTWQKATEGDPSSMYVISDAELQGLESAIFKNDASGIRAINEQISADKTARMTSYETDYKKSLKEYETINSFFASTAFQRTLDERNKAYNDADEEEKKRMDLDPEYWRVHNIDVPGLPDEGVDITQDVHVPLLRAKARATQIDADYRNEHITGSSIAEILNKPLPWPREDKKHPRVTTPEQLQAKIKETMGFDKDLPVVSKEEKGISQEQDKFETFNQMIALGAERPVGEGATTKPPPIDYSGETVGVVETEEPQNRDIGIMQVNEITFGKYNPSQMSQDEMIKFSAKVVNNELPDSTVGEWNNNDGWNNWTTYKNKTGDYKLALGKSDSWLLGKGLSQQQLDKIDEEFEGKKDKRIARAVMWAESKGDHSAININKPKEPKVKGVKQLTKVQDGKTVVNYDVANTSSFKSQQVGLNKTASKKFSSLSKDERKEHGNLRNFMKAKYKEWLKKTGRYGKGVWYSEGDFKYFFPTKVSPKGTVTNISGVDTLDLFDRRLNMHPAFKGVARGSVATTSPSYENFAKDFDEFRKFLQES